ncbi:MAG TPA: MDR family MFS transporter [Oscillatoriaceae cyanobacterium]
MKHDEAEMAGMHGQLSRTGVILVVAGVMLGMLLASLDQTIVGTAMPRVIAELHGMQHYAWVFTAYMLASTVMVPIYGKLSDLYGRRPFFLIGMVLFLVGSALSGTSQNILQLIVYRAIQGLGAGAMMPIAQAIIGDIFPPAERGRLQGILMSVFGLSSIIGPLLGGWITDNWGWRWCFYVNMPVGVLALVTAGFALPRMPFRHYHKVDYTGAGLLIAAAVPMLLAFSWGGTQYAWSSAPVIALLVFSALMWAAFAFVEQRAAEPIITPSLFKNRVFSASVAATFLAGVGMFGSIMYLPLYVQGVLGQSATNSGAVLTPMMLSFMVASALGGWIMTRTGRYKWLAVGAFAIASFGMFLLSRMDGHANAWMVVRNMVITGLGIGVTMSLFTIVVQNAFPFGQLGQVTGSLQFFRSIGGTIGVALLGAAMTSRFKSELTTRLPSGMAHALPPSAQSLLGNPQALVSPEATSALRAHLTALGPQGVALANLFLGAVRTSLAAAVSDVFALGTGLLVLGLIATFFLPEIPLRRGERRAPGEVAAPGAMMAEMATDVAEAGVLMAGGGGGGRPDEDEEA